MGLYFPYLSSLMENKVSLESLTELLVSGETMMIFTSLYFHTFLEKIVGTSCGLGSWYMVYQVVYPKLSAL